MKDPEPFLLDQSDGRLWCVYLFALADCSAFKVGFSCNPLQRICTFSSRYFERFDLSQSLLLAVDDCDSARAIEARVKAELAPVRAPAPDWVSAHAGGHTEWFSAVHFSDAETLLRATDRSTHVSEAFEVFRLRLEGLRARFELWACDEAQRASEVLAAAVRGYRTVAHGDALHDWLDAYRYFDLPIFDAAPETLAFVRQSAQLVRQSGLIRTKH